LGGESGLICAATWARGVRCSFRLRGLFRSGMQACGNRCVIDLYWAWFAVLGVGLEVRGKWCSWVYWRLPVGGVVLGRRGAVQSGVAVFVDIL